MVREEDENGEKWKSKQAMKSSGEWKRERMTYKRQILREVEY